MSLLTIPLPPITYGGNGDEVRIDESRVIFVQRNLFGLSYGIAMLAFLALMPLAAAFAVKGLPPAANIGFAVIAFIPLSWCAFLMWERNRRKQVPSERCEGVLVADLQTGELRNRSDAVLARLDQVELVTLFSAYTYKNTLALNLPSGRRVPLLAQWLGSGQLSAARARLVQLGIGSPGGRGTRMVFV